MRNRLCLVLLLSFLGALLGLLSGAWEVSGQHYLAQGLHRNAAAVLRQGANERTLLFLGFAAAVLLVEGVVRLLARRRSEHALVPALSITLAGALLVQFGWHQNRYAFAHLWKQKIDLLGLPVPRALTDGQAMGVNFLIVIGATLIGAVAYFVLRFLRSRGAGGLFRKSAVVAGLVAAMLLTAANGWAAWLFRNPPAGPNVILISLDTLRADYLSSWGYPKPTSPALDAIAAESVVFGNAITQAPSTLPSHASFLTSRYPSVNGASTQGKKLPKWRIMAAEVFREAGYRVGGIVDSQFLTDLYGLDQGYDDFVERGERIRHIVPRAIRWIRKQGNRPFFLFLHIYDIHAPYAQLPEYKSMFADTEYTGTFRTSDLKDYARAKDRGEDPGIEIVEEDTIHMKTLYAGGIRYADDVLIALFDFLQSHGLLENTILVITGDHGEEFFEHGTFDHGELYRTVTHVPLLVRLPGGAGGGRRTGRLVGLIDLLPTLLDLADIEPPSSLSGRSLAPFLRGAGELPLTPVFSERREGLIDAVTTDRYHLVVDGRVNRTELFDYRSDPWEQHNLSEELPAVTDSLLSLLGEWRARLRAEIETETGLEAEDVRLDAQTTTELRALGYIE